MKKIIQLTVSLVMLSALALCNTSKESDDSSALALAALATTSTTTTGTINGITYGATSAPGDVWKLAVGTTGSTFDLTNETTSLTVSGTITNLKTGFRNLTATASSDSTIVGKVAGALITPNTFVISPYKDDGGSDSRVIGGIKKADCTTVTGDYNYIMFGTPSATSGTNSAEFGTVNFATSSGSVTATINQTTYGGSSETQTVTGGTCSTSTQAVTFTSNGRTVTLFSFSDGITIDQGTGYGGGLGFKKVEFAISSLANKVFAGVVQDAGTSKDTTFPVKITMDSTGAAGTGLKYTDVTTGTTETGGVNIAFTNSSNGLLTGTIAMASTPTTTSPIRGNCYKDTTNSNIVSCYILGLNPNGSQTPFGLQMVSTN